jgi:flagellar biosynthesis protein FlhB
MAEEDDSQKTEEPTSKKIQKARQKGQVAQSQELKSWAMMLAAASALLILAPGLMSDVRKLGQWVLESSHEIDVGKFEVQHLFFQLSIEVGKIVAPLFAVLIIVALVIGGAQTGLLVATAKIKPELKKISIIKGFKSKVSVKQLVEFVKSLIKLALVAGVALGLAVPLLGGLELVPMTSLILSLKHLHLVALWLVAGTVAVMTVIAIIDYIFQKYTYIKGLRMTKQEVKDEHKQSEGDPQIKAQIRRIRNERARARMIAAVPQANVVITNPTHYAVALSYKMEEMRAPRLVAKGVDLVALRIRQVAEESDVPIVENPPLARALFASVELDEEIPPEHFKAVAEVIGYVMRLRGEMPSAAAG